VATIIEIARSQDVGDMSAASPMQSQLFATCPSVLTSKAANDDQVMSGQWTVSGTKLFYPACSLSGKPVLVHQLCGPHFSSRHFGSDEGRAWNVAKAACLPG